MKDTGELIDWYVQSMRRLDEYYTFQAHLGVKSARRELLDHVLNKACVSYDEASSRVRMIHVAYMDDHWKTGSVPGGLAGQRQELIDFVQERWENS